MKTTAILIPTYKRFHDLVNTLEKTKIDQRAKFIIVANLADDELLFITEKFNDRAIIVDEREYGKLGGAKAYNLAFQIAKDNKFDYAILYADDIIPFRADWLDKVYTEFVDKNEAFGIFSSDESHPGHFGWNIILDCPIAHFFIIECKLVDQLFSEEYKQYAVDFEIAVRLQQQGIDIKLLPIKLNHLRSGLHREFMDQNMSEDINTLIKNYPRYETSFRQNRNLHFLKHSRRTLSVSEVSVEQLPLWTELKPVEPLKNRLKKRVKSVINNTVATLGYQITRTIVVDEEAQAIKDFVYRNGWLKEFKINTILDIGANTGQFAKKITALFPSAFIHCFEPLEEPFNKLQENFRGNENIKIYPFALGMQEEELAINSNEYSPSSSFLNMQENHKANFNYAIETTSQKVKVKRLDDLNLDLQEPFLVKIDVQGFEDKVIQGGQATVIKAKILIVEVSFKPMYEDQPLFEDIYKILCDMGFRYQGNLEQLTSPLTGEILQADAIFINSRD